MRHVCRILAAGALVCGAAGLAGLVIWRAATSDSSTALPNGAALPTAVRQGLTYEAWQTYAVQYGVVGVGIAQAGNVQLRTLPAAFAWLDDPPWYQPRLIGRILPPDQAAVFTPTTSEPASADTLEPPGPERSSPSLPPMSPHRRASGRPDRVLNDAQIASIKARLKLTPDQERMWPAVEAALRNISYVKNAVGQNPSARDGGPIAYVDFYGPEVQQLKSVALPLIMRLSQDQKREVNSLAHVIGLDGIAASF
jgi:hypothetical protein